MLPGLALPCAILSSAILSSATLSCATRGDAAASVGGNDPARYRLSDSGERWDRVGQDRVLEDLQPRYPGFFEVVLDPAKTHTANPLSVRDDLEASPVTRRNYDALNAVAIAYFEINHRAEAERGKGIAYLGLSQNAAKLLAIPWRAYSEVDDPALRDAILDFFEDAGSGEKRSTAATAPRLIRIVSSLDGKEDDPARRQRIHEIAAEIEARQPPS